MTTFTALLIEDSFFLLSEIIEIGKKNREALSKLSEAFENTLPEDFFELLLEIEEAKAEAVRNVLGKGRPKISAEVRATTSLRAAIALKEFRETGDRKLLDEVIESFGKLKTAKQGRPTKAKPPKKPKK